MVDKYDERSSRQHIRKLIDVLQKPPVLTATVAPTSNESSAKPPEASEDKLKKHYEEFLEVIKSHSTEEVARPHSQQGKEVLSVLQELF